MIASTRWSRVLAAQAPDTAGRAALAELFEAYRTPLSAFARRRGLDAVSVEDAVQGFAVKLLAHGGIVGAGPDRGRFRNYLLAAFRHHLGDEHRRAHAAKRGG